MLQLQWMKHLTHLLTATFTFEEDGMMANRFQIIDVKRLGSLLVMEISVGVYLCFCTECKCSALYADPFDYFCIISKFPLYLVDVVMSFEVLDQVIKSRPWSTS